MFACSIVRYFFVVKTWLIARSYLCSIPLAPLLIIVSIRHSPETLLGVASKTCDPLWFTSCTECLAQPLTPSLFKSRSWSTVQTSGLRGKRGCPSEVLGMTGGSCDLRQWGGNNHSVTFSWIIKCRVPILVRLKMLHFHLWVWGSLIGCFFLTAVLLLISEAVWADQVVRQAFRAVAAQQHRSSH